MAQTIRTYELHTKEVTNGSQKFPSSTAKIGDEYFKVKFTKECNTSPKTSGVYEIKLALEDCSIQNGEIYTDKDGNKKRGNRTIWVRNVIELRKHTEEEMREANAKAMLEALEGTTFTEIKSDDPLPF